jgi:hypothetical protein
LEAFIRNYPAKFVRLVYCFAYGEPNLLNEEVESNIGTHQFWEIFSACLAPIEDDLTLESEFDRIHKKTPYIGRMRNKVRILNELKRRGIWLIDASIVGFYKGSINDNDIKQNIFQKSWDTYVSSVVADAHPKYVIVIGKNVYKALNLRLDEMSTRLGFKYKVLNQPQGDRVHRKGQLETFRQYQKICVKYAPMH